jgi:uncharacterized membrane protein (DUF4010 family)
MSEGWFESREARVVLALLLGILLGVDRERRKLDPTYLAIAGLRTFALTGLLGGIVAYLEQPYLIALGASIVGGLAIAGYVLGRRERNDAGLTTEVALVLSYLLGALCLTAPLVAAASAIASALLLHLRATLHRFVRDVVREDEVHDALLLLMLAFIALPLAPDVNWGPYGAINPQAIARLMVLVSTISSAGYVAQRLLGPHIGFAASGFASGLISSSATIAALGLRTKADDRIARSAAAGAAASSIATVVQYLFIVAALDLRLLRHLAMPFGFALATAVLATALLARARSSTELPATPEGRAFQLLPAIVIGVGSAVIAVIAAALGDTLGNSGIVVVSSVSGLVDAHATAGTVTSLHRGARVSSSMAELALLAAFSTNTLTKIVLATLSGSRGYALRVAAAVSSMAAMAWLGSWLGRLL